MRLLSIQLNTYVATPNRTQFNTVPMNIHPNESSMAWTKGPLDMEVILKFESAGNEVAEIEDKVVLEGKL